MLVIEDQPIPQVTFKNKSLEDNYVVKLITASNVEIQNISKVKAQLVSEERTWKTEKPLENDESTMDIYNRFATFHHLKVQVSTRMSMVFMKFGVQLQQSNGVSPIIQSHPSYPLIVITNESQWCEAAGKLVLMDSFAGQVRSFFLSHPIQALLMSNLFSKARSPMASICQWFTPSLFKSN